MVHKGLRSGLEISRLGVFCNYEFRFDDRDYKRSCHFDSQLFCSFLFYLFVCFFLEFFFNVHLVVSENIVAILTREIPLIFLEVIVFRKFWAVWSENLAEFVLKIRRSPIPKFVLKNAFFV